MFFLYRGHAVRQLPTTKQNVNVTWKLVGRRKASEQEGKEGKRKDILGVNIIKKYYIHTCTNLQTREQSERKNVLHF